MEIYARVRPRLTGITIPTLWLFGISAGVSFFSAYQLNLWQFYTLWATAITAALLGWLIPVFQYFAKRIDLTSEGVLVKTGIGARHTHEFAWSALASVTATVRGLQFNLKDGSTLTARGYAWPKTIAREIQNAL